MSKFVEADQSQLFLLPPDIRDWIPDDDLAHFVLEAVERVDVSRFRINVRGTGSAQYHPRMMLSLLIYAYANGVFGSRRIERATYRDIGFRFLTADLHPDHDTIAKFRRENLAVFSECFLQVLLLAKELKLLKVGTVSVDGTKIDANASKHRSLRYDRAQSLVKRLEADIAQLVDQADAADSEDAVDPQSLPERLSKRERLKAQMDEACARLEDQAKARAERERAEYEKKVEAREQRKGRRKGKKIKPPDDQPKDDEQTNLTDPDSRLMRKNKRSEYRQSYNAQAVVDADGSQLVLGHRVSQCASDRNELSADVSQIDPRVGQPSDVLADNGYANGDEVADVQAAGIEVLVATGRTDTEREYDFRPPQDAKVPAKNSVPWIVKMQEKLATESGRDKYRLRQQTVEPVFGIVKHVLGFRQFMLRGHSKVETEWCLVMLAYNTKRLHRMVQVA
ncbi:MAG: transposase [Pseudomonadales bacterium]|jgi:transposase